MCIPCLYYGTYKHTITIIIPHKHIYTVIIMIIINILVLSIIHIFPHVTSTNEFYIEASSHATLQRARLRLKHFIRIRIWDFNKWSFSWARVGYIYVRFFFFLFFHCICVLNDELFVLLCLWCIKKKNSEVLTQQLRV